MKAYIEKIANHLVETRPMAEVVYRPYYLRRGIQQKRVLGGICVDLSQIYDKPAENTKVFIKTYVQSQKCEEAFLNIHGSHRAVWMDEMQLAPEITDARGSCYRIRVSSQMSALVVERIFDRSEPELTLTVSTVYYRCMDAKDYLTHIRLLSPYDKENMEGLAVSAPYPLDTEKEAVSWSAPWETKESISFEQIFCGEEGQYAYALTQACKSGWIELKADCTCRLFKMEEPEDRTWTELTEKVQPGRNMRLRLSAGEYLLALCDRGDKNHRSAAWGFSYLDEQDILRLPMMQQTRGYGGFLVLGAFDAINVDYVWNFQRPFYNAGGHRCFWRLPQKGLTVRPYIDSRYFGQWFYALMVGKYGLLKSAEHLHRQDLISYFYKDIQTLADYYEYALFDAAVYGEPPFLQRAVTLDNLDSIGAAGICLAEAYMVSGDSAVLSVLLRLAHAATQNIPRFEDGCYHRETTMWADDVFMSLPFLARMWEITADDRYMKECFCQLEGYFKRLYMPEENLFSHIYFLDKQQKNRIPWGRGNGWVILSMADILRILHKHHAQEAFPEEYDLLANRFRTFVDGLIACQDENGMLHQVLNDRSSYPETSCTGMFAVAILYGITCGMLEAEKVRFAEKAIHGILNGFVTDDGVIQGVCRGSSCSMEAQYYKQLGTIEDDDHGTGIVLLALTAYDELKNRGESE